MAFSFSKTAALKTPIILKQDKGDINLKVDLTLHSGWQCPPQRDFRDIMTDAKSISKNWVGYQIHVPDITRNVGILRTLPILNTYQHNEGKHDF